MSTIGIGEAARFPISRKAFSSCGLFTARDLNTLAMYSGLVRSYFMSDRGFGRLVINDGRVSIQLKKNSIAGLHMSLQGIAKILSGKGLSVLKNIEASIKLIEVTILPLTDQVSEMREAAGRLIAEENSNIKGKITGKQGSIELLVMHNVGHFFYHDTFKGQIVKMVESDPLFQDIEEQLQEPMGLLNIYLDAILNQLPV